MKFINNTDKKIKVSKEIITHNQRGFTTVKPGESIEAKSEAFQKGYIKDGLTLVKGKEKPAEEPMDEEPEVTAETSSIGDTTVETKMTRRQKSNSRRK